MKICCDVCKKEEACVFCAADEAALCNKCDQRVHHANKLASKHVRFPLLNPSPKESPLCDICQERRAFLFCQEDRAILCRECDIPIHGSNQHTQKHNRFLLTGVKLSPPSTASHSSPSAASSSNDCEVKTSVSNQFSPYTMSSNEYDQNQYHCTSNKVQDQNSMSTSSISEYLETLPGWGVDEFLDPSNGFCKIADFQSSFLDHAFDANSYASFGSSGTWVPHFPPQTFIDEQNSPKSSMQWPVNESRIPQTSRSIKRSRNFADDVLRSSTKAEAIASFESSLLLVY